MQQQEMMQPGQYTQEQIEVSSLHGVSFGTEQLQQQD